jgi:hypothetical protein
MELGAEAEDQKLIINSSFSDASGELWLIVPMPRLYLQRHLRLTGNDRCTRTPVQRRIETAGLQLPEKKSDFRLAASPPQGQRDGVEGGGR